MREGMSAGRRDEVTSCAATDFKNVVAGAGREPVQHTVPAEEIPGAGQIIDMTLLAIDFVHQGGMIEGDVGQGCQPSNV